MVAFAAFAPEPQCLIADFTLDTEPVGLGLTGLAALALGTGVSSADIY